MNNELNKLFKERDLCVKTKLQLWDTAHPRYKKMQRWAMRWTFSVMGPSLRRAGNAVQLTDIGHLWANVALDANYKLLLVSIDGHTHAGDLHLC